MKQTSWPLYILAILLVVSVASNLFLFLERENLSTSTAELTSTLRAERSETTKQLYEASTTIAMLTDDLEDTIDQLNEAEDDYRDEKRRNDDLEDEVRDTINTVRDLDKLSKTDEELLQKYSRVYFLNENYIPSKLRKIDQKYVLDSRGEQYFHGDALPYLEDMLDAAKKDGIDLKVISAYRSFDSQAQLKGQYTQTYGTGANAFSADQGYSEHQLGTTLDLSDPETNGPYLAFENTEEFEWLEDNAYRYGFVLSYPKDNTFYVFEPWHWRFVGEALARDLHKDKAYFYDWDQRTIDEYLLNIFD